MAFWDLGADVSALLGVSFKSDYLSKPCLRQTKEMFCLCLRDQVLLYSHSKGTVLDWKQLHVTSHVSRGVNSLSSFCCGLFLLLPLSWSQAGFTGLKIRCLPLLLLDVDIFLITLQVVLQICQGLKILLQMQNKCTTDLEVLQFLHVKPLPPGSLVPCFPQLHSRCCHNHTMKLLTSAPLFILTSMNDCQ